MFISQSPKLLSLRGWILEMYFTSRAHAQSFIDVDYERTGANTRIKKKYDHYVHT